MSLINRNRTGTRRSSDRWLFTMGRLMRTDRGVRTVPWGTISASRRLR